MQIILLTTLFFFISTSNATVDCLRDNVANLEILNQKIEDHQGIKVNLTFNGETIHDGVFEKIETSGGHRFIILYDNGTKRIVPYSSIDKIQATVFTRKTNPPDLAEPMPTPKTAKGDETPSSPAMEKKPPESSYKIKRKVSGPDDPSIYPGGQRKSPVDVVEFRERVKAKFGDDAVITPDDLHNTVDDGVFSTLLGQGKKTQTPYVAAAFDPLTGAYSVQRNTLKLPTEPDELATVSHRSQRITGNIEEFKEVKVHERLIGEGTKEVERKIKGKPKMVEVFRDGESATFTYKDPTIKNGATGFHAEVKAADNVLYFKDSIGRCIRSKEKCEKFKDEEFYECIKFYKSISERKDCEADQIKALKEHFKIEIDSRILNECLKDTPDKCFPDPGEGGTLPSSLAYDIRGGAPSTALFKGTEDARVRINGMRKGVGDLQGQFFETTTETTTKVTDKTSMYLQEFYKPKGKTDDKLYYKLISQIVSICEEKRNNLSAGVLVGCETAYLVSVRHYCIKKPSECTDTPDIEKARRFVTEEISGAETFGAGHRCFNCWHLLGRQEHIGTLQPEPEKSQ